MDDIFNHQYGTKQALLASGATNAALQSWIRRGLIVGHKGEGVDMPGSPGARRVFSFFNVVEIAVAKALTDAGVAPYHAFKAAGDFAHIGKWRPDGPEREVGMPFKEDGMTLLAVAGDHSEVWLYRPGEDVLPFLFSELGRPQSIVLLNVDDVFRNAMSNLGYDAGEVIAYAYKNSGEA